MAILECICGRCGCMFVKLRRRGSCTHCKRCLNYLRIQKWRIAHPGYERVQPSKEAKKRFEKSPRGMQLSREKASRFYHKHKHDPAIRERFRAGCRQNYARHPEAYKQRAVARKVHVKRATPSWSDQEAIAAIYQQARLMSNGLGIKYTVDHIVPLRGKDVSGLHVPYNLQILTLSENCSKKNAMA
jgi:hypothetical protein